MTEVQRTTTTTVTTSPAGIVTTVTTTDTFKTPQSEIEVSTNTTTSSEETTIELPVGGQEPKKSKKEQKKQAKKEAKKEGKKEKKEGKKAEQPAKEASNYPEGIDDKMVKKARKEGGKKGQDLAGMADMGGISFFHVAMESCEGNFFLLEQAMEGANVEVDETAEDRKGGASKIGKMFLSASVEQLAVLVHLPECLKEKLTLNEWVSKINEEIKGEILEQTDNTAKIVAKLDEANGRFPLKLRDSAINAGFALLRSKNLVMDEDSDDDIDYESMQEAAGIEW